MICCQSKEQRHLLPTSHSSPSSQVHQGLPESSGRQVPGGYHQRPPTHRLRTPRRIQTEGATSPEGEREREGGVLTYLSNYEVVTYNPLFIFIPESCWLFLSKLFFKPFFFLCIKWEQHKHTVLREWYFLLQRNNIV